MNLSFGAWLKKRRRLLDLTQEDLAARAFCSVNSIRKIESGDLVPSKALALEIARALNVPERAHAEFIRLARTPDAVVPENAFGETPAPVSTAATAETAIRFHPPAPLTAALGREHDTSVVARALRLPATRLVTLTGPPGTGKTRLSLEVADELKQEFENGAAFVALAPISHASLVEDAIAQALNVRESPHTALASTLRAFLRDKQLLLVLDNFEHVMDAASVVTGLLRLAPRLKILVTSRELLHVYGEREIALAPLGVPPLVPLPELSALENFPAVQLFVERAQAVKPDFALTKENAETIARLVFGLDGLPLAIEMAAPRVKWQSPQQLLAQLSKRLELLAGRPRDLDARQRTLRGALDWSYDLLEENERRVFGHAGVFRGGFTAQAADAVLGESVEAILQTLVEKSLVKRDRVSDDPARYDLLDTIREYALEQLARAGQTEIALTRHAAFFRDLARRIAAARAHGTRGAWQRFETGDGENFRLALDWYAEQDREEAIAFASDLYDFWSDRGLAREGRERLTALLRAQDSPAQRSGLVTLAALAIDQGDFDEGQTYAERVRSLSASEKISPPLARSLQLLGYIALMRGEFARAEELLLESRAQFQALDLPSYEARALNNLGLIAKDRGDFLRAEEYHLAALALRRALGLQSDIAQSLFNLAIVAYWRGDYARAIELGNEAYELYVADAGVFAGSYVLETIGMAHFKRGEFERATRALETSLTALRHADDKRGLALILHALGDVALEQEQFARAQQYYREALQLALQTGEKRRAAFCLEGFAATFNRVEEASRAAMLFGAADALRQEIGIPVYASEREVYDAELARVRANLSASDFENAWRAGRATQWEHAIALASQ